MSSQYDEKEGDMQYIKLFWLTFVGVWREVVGGETRSRIQYDNLLKMISDEDFSDSLVEREFFRFCQTNNADWRLSRVLDEIGGKRPVLFRHLDKTLRT